MRPLLVPIALLLGGCASGGPVPPPVGTARAAFVGPSTIAVTVNDIQPASRVDLVGPQGTLAATQIDTEQLPAYGPGGGTSVGVGVGAGGGGGGGFSFGGLSLGFPLGGSGAPSYYGGTVLSTAYIRLPAPGSYAADWQQSQIHIQFGVPPAARVLTVPAPAPPAA